MSSICRSVVVAPKKAAMLSSQVSSTSSQTSAAAAAAAAATVSTGTPVDGVSVVSSGDASQNPSEDSATCKFVHKHPIIQIVNRVIRV